MADREPERDQHDDRRRLHAGQRVLDEASGPEAAHVDQRQHRDRPAIDTIGFAPAAHRNEARDVVGERDGAGRDRAGEAGNERGPPGEERRERTEGVAQVDVLAAGVRPHRRELGVGHRAGEREQRRRRATRRASPSDWAPAAATMIGTKKMPPPMTLEMTIAAASSGPRRRSRWTAGRRGAHLLGQDLARNVVGRDLHPLRWSCAWRRCGRACPGTGSSSACRRATAARRRCNRPWR